MSDDIVRTAWRHAEASRNALPIVVILFSILQFDFCILNSKLLLGNNFVDTPVVHALNDDVWFFGVSTL